MEKPPDKNCRGNDEQSERLVTPERTPLHLAPFVFGYLLIVRLDAAFNHAAIAGVPRLSIGCRRLSIELLDGRRLR